MSRFTKFIFLVLTVSVLAISGMSQPSDYLSERKSVDLGNAARQNSVLINTLRWKWGRQQKGWQLYVPLLKHTLKIEADPGSTEFASAVAKWQESNGTEATGILDEKTLFSFIGYWQARRIKPVYEAGREMLLDAPIADFFDQTREASLLKVDKNAYLAYKRLIEAARADLKTGNMESTDQSLFLTIISSYRSPEYQAELRKKEPGMTRAQLAFRSPHFTGRALDIFVGGEPVSTKDANRAIQIETKAYQWLVKNAEKFGFFPYFYEPWHWEYVGRGLTIDD